MAQRVGPYVISKTLGVGSTGRVKLGTHVETNQSVAVKIVSKEWLASRASLTKKIEREITLMKLIKHPNVLHLYDVYESNAELFLILEHVEGGELFDYLVKRGRLPENEALIFFQQIIGGLDFCHQHMICHRDLKPENLLLDGSLNVKIADFGMATLQQKGKDLETSCGSPHYASPEIIRGVKYDGAAADIWSCGVILYALLTGNLPFDDENIRKLLSKVKSGLYFMPSSLSEQAQDLIRKMLVVDPEKRISISDIKQHAWFKVNNATFPAATFPEVHLEQVESPDDLDTNIIQNLKTLGWESEQDLIDAVLSKDNTVEKVFYQLLFERKEHYFETLDDDWDDPASSGPRRREDSFSSEFRERKSSRHGDEDGTLTKRKASTSDKEKKGSVKGKKKSTSLSDPSEQLSTLAIKKNAMGDANAEDGTAPKRSWFANLFNFKGEVASLKSSRPLPETVEELLRVLHAHDVKVQPGNKDATFKCKLDGGAASGGAAPKGCKFRIEIIPSSDLEFDVVFIQQQGQTSSFTSIYKAVKADLKVSS